MNETLTADIRPRPAWKTTLLAVLLLLDAVVTLFPPLYWSAGSDGRAFSALLYFIGGSTFVLISLVAMYATDTDEERQP